LDKMVYKASQLLRGLQYQNYSFLKVSLRCLVIAQE